MFLGNLPLPLGEAALPLALLVIWAALLFGGFAIGSSGAGTSGAGSSRRMPTWTRLGSSGSPERPTQALIVTSVAAASMIAAPHLLSTLPW